MRVHESSSTQSPPEDRDAGAPAEARPVALVEDAVPLLDPAARELHREREERVRVIVGRGRPRLPRPPRRAVAAICLALVFSVGTVVLALGAGGNDRGTSPKSPTASPRRTAEAIRAPTTAEPTGAPRPTPSTGARRRATLAARREAARRRGRAADRRHQRRPHQVRDARKDHAPDPAPRAPAAAADAAVAEGGAEAPAPVEAATPEVEAAPEPESAPPPASAPAPEAPAEGGSTSTPSQSTAEGEFGFER